MSIDCKKNNRCFVIDCQDGAARAGKIFTPHGVIQTPAYVPVATNAVIKGCDSQIIDEIDIDLLFVNTYHMLVHPGDKIVKNAGGLHTFMQRKKPIITDSGGFQIFSLKYGGVAQELKSKGTKKDNTGVLKVTEEGVLFRSYRDGSLLFMTPESTIQAQKNLGADIIIPLDELLPFHIDEVTFAKSFDKTHRWQIRSFHEHEKNKQNQLIYAVIHGSVYPEFRQKSAQLLSAYNFDGFAIGGSLGKNTNDVIEVLKETLKWLPPEKPRHLLGIADLKTISAALALGIDTFDSAYPTKCARHGWLFTDNGPIKITQSKWVDVHEPCSGASRLLKYTYAYLHHLFKSHEQTAGMFASIHNIWYLNEYCKKRQKHF
jgi:queuine tRNA-ribosyltransferase